MRRPSRSCSMSAAIPLISSRSRTRKDWSSNTPLSHWRIIRWSASAIRWVQRKRSYLLRLSENGKENESDPAAMQVVSGTLSALESAVQEGSTHYYFTIEGNDRLFIAPLSLSSELVMSEVGDAVQVRYVESEDMTIVIDAFDNETMHYDDPEE